MRNYKKAFCLVYISLFNLSIGSSIYSRDLINSLSNAKKVKDKSDDSEFIVAGIKMRKIHGGTFTMGSSDIAARSNETPHTVKVGDFAMMKYEVTVTEFKNLLMPPVSRPMPKKELVVMEASLIILVEFGSIQRE